MLSTLIISDKLWVPNWVNMDSSKWRASRPSAEGYDVVVLDLYFGAPHVEGYCTLPRDGAHFYELGTEVAKSLQAGGVVIALVGPLTVTTRNLRASYAKEVVSIKRKAVFQYEGKYTGDEETSYEWLDHGFLLETRIDAMFVKESEGITSVSPRREMDTYISRWANKYWLTIDGIDLVDKATNMGTITHSVAQPGRWHKATVSQYPAKILAIGKHTKLPVAAAMQYMNWDGVLILLPPYELREKSQPAANEEIGGLLYALEGLAKGIREDFAMGGVAEHEDWVYEHRAIQAKAIVSEIEGAKQKEKQLAEKLEPYDQMLVLLDGTGDPLVDGVITLFDRAGEGLRVEKTEKGAPIDLFVYDNKARRLVIEVTGIKGNLTKDDSHWADFLGYMPDHNARNERGRVERIVLVVNTQCKTKLDGRNRQNDVSRHVRDTCTDNHICVIRSCDLYGLWLETLNGKRLQEIFDSLFECEGIWRPRG